MQFHPDSQKVPADAEMERRSFDLNLTSSVVGNPELHDDGEIPQRQP